MNRLAAIQAAAEILDDNNDLSRNDRHLFLTFIRTETPRLHRILAALTTRRLLNRNQPRKGQIRSPHISLANHRARPAMSTSSAERLQSASGCRR